MVTALLLLAMLILLGLMFHVGRIEVLGPLAKIIILVVIGIVEFLLALALLQELGLLVV